MILTAVANGVGVRGAGGASALRKVLICQKFLKIRAKMASNVVWFEKMVPNFSRKTQIPEDFFVFWRSY